MTDNRLTASPWSHPATLWWILVWVALMIVAELTRPALPVDETRYLAVAWEMFQSDTLFNYIVPHLNGQPYDHKPPLLFWLMAAGWHVFGVNDWWGALVAPLFGLASLGLTVWLAGLIWPRGILGDDARLAAAIAPVLLVGALFWALFTTLTMFDMMLTALTLLAIGGLVKAWRFGGKGPWVLVALGIGLGVLAKGPAILLHILPAALLAPLWGPKLIAANPQPYSGYKAWYLGILAAVIGGAVMALAWAVPAGILGGETYREAIFWGQSAGRVVNADDHARPWYWFFMVMPVMVLPWILWPPLWRGVARLPFVLSDAGIRLGLVWFIPAFVTFSIISGKQAHYLLPDFPALALIAARLLTEPDMHDRAKPKDQWWPAIPLALLAAAAAVFPYVASFFEDSFQRIQTEITIIDGYWMLSVVVVALAILVTPIHRLAPRAMALSALTATLVISFHMAMNPLLMSHYDQRPMGQDIRAWMEEGRPVAYYGKYHGQFQFPGRLPGPLERIPAETYEITDDWAKANPNGVVIFQSRTRPTDGLELAVHPFRSRYMVAWPSEAVANNPARVVDGMSREAAAESWADRNQRGEDQRPEVTERFRLLLEERGIDPADPFGLLKREEPAAAPPVPAPANTIPDAVEKTPKNIEKP